MARLTDFFRIATQRLLEDAQQIQPLVGSESRARLGAAGEVPLP
jgi:hypothetical protein